MIHGRLVDHLMLSTLVHQPWPTSARVSRWVVPQFWAIRQDIVGVACVLLICYISRFCARFVLATICPVLAVSWLLLMLFPYLASTMDNAEARRVYAPTHFSLVQLQRVYLLALMHMRRHSRTSLISLWLVVGSMLGRVVMSSLETLKATGTNIICLSAVRCIYFAQFSNIN